MKKMDPFRLRNPTPSCIGTGLIVLDVVLNERLKPLIGTGGSCGNVLSILSSLGWNTYPLARIGHDINSRYLLQDLRRWKVKTNYIAIEQNLATPVIIERLTHDKADVTHVFEFKCPNCGAGLPKNRLINESVVLMSRKIPSPEVFYFDRTSETVLRAVKERKSEGALIVFEPCSHRIRDSFYEAARLADIIKYSAKEFANHISISEGQLEIQTSGAAGIKFRSNRNGTNNWKAIDAYSLEEVVDAAGAGDLCTAGIIHSLGQYGRRGFLKVSDMEIENAIKFGQALAALGCSFKGARGHMYNLTRKQIEQLTIKIMKNEIPKIKRGQKRWNDFRYHCIYCG
jgi:fructokinase